MPLFIFKASRKCEYTFLKFGNEGAYLFNTIKVEATRNLFRQMFSS